MSLSRFILGMMILGCTHTFLAGDGAGTWSLWGAGTGIGLLVLGIQPPKLVKEDDDVPG